MKLTKVSSLKSNMAFNLNLETMFGPFFVHPIPIIDATFCVASLMQHQSVVDLLLSKAKSDEDERLLLS